MPRRAQLALVLWLVTMGLAAWQLVTRTHVQDDLSGFMPTARTSAQALLQAQLREGPAARVVLVALEGAPAAGLAAASRALAARLQAREEFSRVLNGAGLPALDTERWFRYRYLLSPAVSSARFTAEGLRAALEQRLQELTAPVLRPDRRHLAADPTDAFGALLARWRIEGPARQHGVWFSGDGTRALLLVETRAAGLDLAAQAQALQRIRAAHASVTVGEDVRLLLSGPAVFAAEARSVIQQEVQRASIAASILVIGLLIVAYRRLRLVLLGSVPLIASMVVAAAVTAWLFGGALHGITLAFGATLLGVAVDYPLHLFSHLVPGSTAEVALRRLWPVLRLGVITTVVGYGALISVDFPGLAQLGVFAATGLVAAALVTRFVLPGLLAGVDARDTANEAWTEGALRPRPGLPWLLPLGALILVVVAWWRGAPLWETDLAALSPVPPALRALDTELRRELGAADPGQLLLIEAPDAQTALARSEAVADLLDTLVQEGSLRRYDYPARYLPSQATQRARQSALPAPDTLAANLAAAAEGLPFRAAAFQPFLDDVAQARDLAPLGLEDIRDTVLETQVRRLLLERPRGSVAVVSLHGLRDATRLAALIEGRGPAGVHHVDVARDTAQLMREFRDAGLSRFAWGSGLIVLVLGVGLRSAWQAVRVATPVVLAMAMTVALLASIGERLSLFHLVSLLLVAGIGVDYSLFFLHSGATDRDRRRTLHAVTACALSTLSVFGILAASRLPVLQAIGLTAVIGVAAAYMLAWAARRTEPASQDIRTDRESDEIGTSTPEPLHADQRPGPRHRGDA